MSLTELKWRFKFQIIVAHDFGKTIASAPIHDMRDDIYAVTPVFPAPFGIGKEL